MTNALTVDVEEWFHVCGVGGPLAPTNWPELPSRVVETTRRVLDLLDRTGARATFFVLGWVAERHPELVLAIQDAGHEIGSHGHTHTRVYELTPQAFADDLAASLHALAEAGARSVLGFRAPEWSINDRSLWALEILARHGFRFDSSMTPLRLIGNPSYPQAPHRRSTSAGDLMEFPPLVGRRLGQNIPLGGGWGLRMSRAHTVLHEIDARNRAGRPVALFLHPWELDPEPPRIRLPLGLRFAHYFRLHGFERRLEDVLRGATFSTMSDVLEIGREAA